MTVTLPEKQSKIYQSTDERDIEGPDARMVVNIEEYNVRYQRTYCV